MQKSNFQVIFIGIFIACAVAAIAIFAGFIKLPDKAKTNGPTGAVVMWGTVPSRALGVPLQEFNNKQSYSLSYIEKNSDTFETDLIEALASGTGPDLFLLPQDSLYRFENKIIPIPYTNFSAENFRANYAQITDVLLAKDGILGFPMAVDPLIMYYNPNLLEAKGIPLPPKTWDEVVAIAPKLTVKTNAGIVSKASIGLGEYTNIDNAKAIISALFLQAGSPIVSRDISGTYTPKLLGTGSTNDALRFYMSFSDTSNPVYTWNKSLRSSRDMFVAGDLAMYLGFASELPTIARLNPNLKFYVSQFPQAKDGLPSNFGRLYSVVISKSSKNLNGAYGVAGLFAASPVADAMTQSLSMTPVLRTKLAAKPQTTFGPILYDQALVARTWIDPNAAATDTLFKTMIADVTSGRSAVEQAISMVQAGLQSIFYPR